MRSYSAPLVWRAILGIVIGIVTLTWPDITVGAFVILFAVYAFIAAGIEASRAFRSATAGPVVGRLLLALVDILAGLSALLWPGLTALVLVWILAGWAFATGVIEIAAGFGRGETAGERASLIVTGLLSVVLAVAFAVRPDIGAVTIAQVYGIFSIVAGVAELILAHRIRKVGEALGAAAT